MKAFPTNLIALSLSISCVIAGGALPTCSAPTSGDSDFKSGITAYKRGDYKTAAENFHKAVTGGMDTAAAWLYLGHAYMGSGDRARASQIYRTLSQKFPGTNEARIAAQCLQKLPPPAAPATAGAAPGATPATATGAKPAEIAGKKTTLIDRITLYPPKFGHTPVSQTTAETVKAVVHGLPRHILKILDDCGATITIAPNIIDKWPGSGDGLKPGKSDMTMGEEPGRTYGHDVHLYEREQIRGTTNLKEVRPQSEIHHMALHEIGHAIDDCSGVLSNDSTFKAMLKLDLSEITDDVRSKIEYYTQPGEACAETINGLLGGTDEATCALVLQSLPRTTRFLKERLHL
jgi:tetratricopeptide (TPR) repeat protein